MKEFSKKLYLLAVQFIYGFISKTNTQENKNILFVQTFDKTFETIDKNISNLSYNKVFIDPTKVGLIKTLKLIKTSKYIFCDNYFVLLAVINTEKKVITQCWHAPGALKKIGFENEEVKNQSLSSQKRYQKVYDSYDYYLCCSEHMKEVFMTSFRQAENKMIEINYLKSKFYQSKEFKKEASIISENNPKIITKLNLLYLPTFRTEIEENLEQVKFLQYLSENTKGEYNIFYKLHNKISDQKRIRKQLEKIENITEVTNLKTEYYYQLADVLITDYSSVVFDYNLFSDNILLYGYDYENYRAKRGFNLDFSQEIITERKEILNQLTRKSKGQTITKLNFLKEKQQQFYQFGFNGRKIVNKILEKEDVDNEYQIDYEKYGVK